MLHKRSTSVVIDMFVFEILQLTCLNALFWTSGAMWFFPIAEQAAIPRKKRSKCSHWNERSAICEYLFTLIKRERLHQRSKRFSHPRCERNEVLPLAPANRDTFNLHEPSEVFPSALPLGSAAIGTNEMNEAEGI